MEVGAAVWVRDKDGDEAWVAGIVLEKSEGKPCKVKIEVDEEFSEEPLTFTFSDDDGYELEDLKLANDEEMDHVEDLIALPHLHEAAILHSLCRRFDRGDIYTFTANAILLAVNPFKSLPLYGKELLTEYFNMGYMRQQGIEPPQALGPHVFAIADSAYRDMMKGIHAGKSAGMGPVNQSILISGESGAGKTESTKFVMRYLTTVGNGEDGVELEKGSIMDRVLQSNPILEAFGNARTIRNDNSSRFGKFIELMFDKRGNLLGAGIETYLLEKVRIPTQAENERNFHIFYQMCKGGDEEERERWELQGPEEYHFVNQGECYDLRKVDDEDEFVQTKDALKTMGFEDSSVQTIFDIMAGLIHLGELEFESHEEDESALLTDDDDNKECMERVCRLCYLPQDGLLRALTSKTIEVGPRKEKTTIKLKDHQAYDARDALAKAFYGQLFNWLVATINSHINCDRKEVKASVGVLDIFGFECFEHNSFEQLCINYTNETLQQQFNQFVFKMEQKEYSKEGIEWSFVEFPDNQDCLDLIEGKQNGLLTMLDDECRMGIRGTDANYASRLYKEHTSTGRFEADSAMQTKLCFAVKHYAGQVMYSVETFCDKNKDELPKESDELFASSTNPFVVTLFDPTGGKTKKTKGKKPAAPKAKKDAAGVAGLKPTVGTQFKDQLHNLMDMIRDTRPHYIRCIKPNDNAEPDEVSRIRVMEQLRYGGVLEAVRVARSGYPVRLPHKDFYTRYRCLISLDPKVKKSKYPLRLTGASTVAQKMCKELVNNVLSPAMVSMKNIPADTMQFGKSKVFLRKNAHDFLEMIRSQRITSAAVTLQRMARGFVWRRVFFATRNALLLLQRMSRGMIARRKVNHMRRMRAALRTQTAFRRYAARKKYLSLRGATLALQCAARWRKAAKVHNELRRQHRATKIQSWSRMLGPWRAYRKLRSATLALQCRMRQRIAYGELRDLRIKAKDVGNLKEDNERLKAEILALRQTASQAAASAGDERLSAAMKEADGLRDEVEKLRVRVGELETQVADGNAATRKAEVAAEAAKARADALAQAAGDSSANDERESLRARIAELELTVVQEKEAAADAAAAAGAGAPSPASGDLESKIAELEAALEAEKEKSAAAASAAAAAAASATAPAAAGTDANGDDSAARSIPAGNGAEDFSASAALRARVAELEAELQRKAGESSSPSGGEGGGDARASELEHRVSELEAELVEEKKAKALASASAAAAAAAAASSSSSDRGSTGGGGGSESTALRARVAKLEKELAAERMVVKAAVTKATAAASASGEGRDADEIDEDEEKESAFLRKQLGEMEAALLREKQERERAVVERGRAEDLAKRMAKSLKDRAVEAMSGEEGAAAAPNGSAPATAKALSENGECDEDGDHLLMGMSNEDMMLSNLSQVLDEEREARRAAEEENERLQAEADAATDAQRAQAKLAQTLQLELDDARKAQKLAEDKAAIAAASAAALVASDSGRPRTVLEGNALRTPTSAWRGAVHGFDGSSFANANGGPSNSNAGSIPGSPGSTGNSAQGSQGNKLHTNAVLEFEERLEAIKVGLSQGVDCVVWEDKTRQVEATMSVVEGEAGSSKLTFAAKGSYLIFRAPVRPLQMNASLKIALGHGDMQGLANQDDSTFLNIRYCNSSEDENPRTVIVKVADKEMRNDLVSSVRRLLTQAKVGALYAEMRGPAPVAAAGSRGRPGISRRVSSVFDMGGGGRSSLSIASPPRPSSGRPSLGPQAASFSVGSGGQGFSRSPPQGGGGLASATPSLPRRSQNQTHQGDDLEMVDLLRNQLEQLAMAKEAEIQAKEVELQESRLASERTMVQMMELTNEVNTKQDEIRLLKRQATEAIEDMEEMRRTHKDNAQVSMQLLKKMEGLQFDNEELRHETEFLRNKVASFYHEAQMRADERDHGHDEGIIDMREVSPDGEPHCSSSGDGMPPAPLSPSGSVSSFASYEAPARGGGMAS